MLVFCNSVPYLDFVFFLCALITLDGQLDVMVEKILTLVLSPYIPYLEMKTVLLSLVVTPHAYFELLDVSLEIVSVFYPALHLLFQDVAVCLFFPY